MPWVTTKGYSPGKRHFHEGPYTRTWGEVVTRQSGDRTYTHRYFTDRVEGAALCNDRPYYPFLQKGGYTTEWSDGHRGYTSGGLSVKETVNLMQSNICANCRKRYIEQRPELQAAVEALRKAQVMS